MHKWLACIFLLCTLAACASPAETLTPTPAAPTPTMTPPATHTPLPPTATATHTVTPIPTPTFTPTATPTATPTPTPLPPVTLGHEMTVVQDAQSLLADLGDRPGYEIQAVVDMETLTVTGQQRVSYTNRHPFALDALYFNLYPNAPRFGKEMTVDDLVVNGQPVKVLYEKERRALRVPLSPPLEPGRQVVIELSFEVEVLEMDKNDYRPLVYSKGILSLGGWYPMLAVLDESGWHLDYHEEIVGEAIMTEIAFYAVDITLPESFVVAATGNQVAEIAGGTSTAGTRTLRYRSGPARTFYLTASPDYLVESAQMGGTTVRSFYLPGDERCGLWSLEAAQAALQLYGELYGPYLFTEFDVVESDHGYQGFEWPGLMLIGDMLYEGEGPACGEWFVAHETAHQWWYNVVGSDPVAHPWLDEALVQYSTMLYYRRLWPADAAEAYVQAIIYDRYAQYADRPQGVHIDQPTTAFAERKEYYAITYAHGAMFFEALHQALGDEAFFAALQQYYQKSRFQIASPADLYAALHPFAPEAVEKLWKEWMTAE